MLNPQSGRGNQRWRWRKIGVPCSSHDSNRNSAEACTRVQDRGRSNTVRFHCLAIQRLHNYVLFKECALPCGAQRLRMFKGCTRVQRLHVFSDCACSATARFHRPCVFKECGHLFNDWLWVFKAWERSKTAYSKIVQSLGEFNDRGAERLWMFEDCWRVQWLGCWKTVDVQRLLTCSMTGVLKDCGCSQTADVFNDWKTADVFNDWRNFEKKFWNCIFSKNLKTHGCGVLRL
jgi:hypothetical protein